MVTTHHSESTPCTLQQLLQEVIQRCPEPENVQARVDTLLTVIKHHHFWPMLQMKKFFSQSNLVLLHNTYKRIDVDHFQQLYDECRSVVIDVMAPLENMIVVHLTQGIPERLDDRQYEALMEPSDRCEMSYEGTMIFVYQYDEKWHIGTSGCPTIDASRYHHPTKTHGVMLDECLERIFGQEIVQEEGEPDRDFYKRRGGILRTQWTDLLNPSHAYTFLMVHHENRHIMNYEKELGEKYSVLYHLHTRKKGVDVVDDEGVEFLKGSGIQSVKVFESPEEALKCLRENPIYGFIVRKDARVLRVSAGKILQHEESDLGNHNKWQNMLWTFLQNKCHFTVEDYIREYAQDLELPRDHLGRVMQPDKLIQEVIQMIVSTITNLYKSTTKYSVHTRKFRMDKEMDGALPPILRFHLGQLRRLQITDHTHAMIGYTAVYDYIRHHQTLKNIRLLIRFFAMHDGPEMDVRQQEYCKTLHSLLTN